MRRPGIDRTLPRRTRGVVLLVMAVMLAMGGAYFLIRHIVPAVVDAQRLQRSSDAMQAARDSLIGYAATYRERQAATGTVNNLYEVYGYLPLPDLGTSRNNNSVDADCGGLEGCSAANFSGNGTHVTVIGRFPWRKLGTGPLRDGYGECLWYVVSGSHQMIQQSAPMNWDALGQIDVVTAKGDTALASVLASTHDRPVAIIFSPGPMLSSQNRASATTDTVTECGGNYDVRNYLDPVTATALGGTTNYFSGSTNAATGNTSSSPKALAISGSIMRRGSDGSLWPTRCPTPADATCEQVNNDLGISVNAEAIYRTVRNSGNFQRDINMLLDRIATCLRDSIHAGTVTAGYSKLPSLPVSTCYDDSTDPRGYFSHYKDQMFVAQCAGGCNVTLDGTAQSCAATLLFGNQRAAGQARTNATEQASAANYLEGDNLSSFTASGNNFSGHSKLASVSKTQTATQDVLRCIPAGPNFTDVASPRLNQIAPGMTSLATYDAGTQTLTMGGDGVSSSDAAKATALYGCSWNSTSHTRGSGLRTYFRFRIPDTGDGFTYAVVDADRNSGTGMCGAARQHLGYSGNNGDVVPIAWPKLAIEFDTSFNCNKPYTPYYDANGNPSCIFTEANSTLNNGRNDPCYTSSCGASEGMNNSSHVAIMYWGNEAANASDGVTLSESDDNVHGFPNSTTTTRPEPRNAARINPAHPSPPPYPPYAIAPLDRMRDSNTINRDFHVRVEITPQTQSDSDKTELRRTWKIEAWVLPTYAKQITALQWTQNTDAQGQPLASGVATITVPGHGFSNNDKIAIRGAPSVYNGSFTISNKTTDTFQYAVYPNPGSTSVSADTVAMKETNQVIHLKDTTRPMSVIEPVTRFGVCTSDANCASGQSCGGIETDGTRYCYTGLKPLVYDTPTIYDILAGDCGAGGACPTNQSCGPGNKCYQNAFRVMRQGFTIGAGSSDQIISVSEFSTTWVD